MVNPVGRWQGTRPSPSPLAVTMDMSNTTNPVGLPVKDIYMIIMYYVDYKRDSDSYGQKVHKVIYKIQTTL